MTKTLANAYTVIDHLDMLQEECAELIQAASKYKRSIGHGFLTNKSKVETYDSLAEEIADVENCIRAIQYLFNITDDDLNKIINAKDARCQERLNEFVREKTNQDPEKFNVMNRYILTKDEESSE